jgi:RNA recognition motif-containing protein
MTWHETGKPGKNGPSNWPGGKGRRSLWQGHPGKTDKEKVMSKRLSVSNLPHQMTGEQLQTLFSEAGYVASAKIITYLHNGESCGFGFVAMKTQEESQKAISMFNCRLVNGRPLTVKEDSPQSKCSFGRRNRKCR